MPDSVVRPPEGALVDSARKRVGLSQRRAAALAELSEGRWRQIIEGEQRAGGGRIPVRAPAPTLARMAAVVALTPEQLENVGRPDAAAVMRQHREADREHVDDTARAIAADSRLSDAQKAALLTVYDSYLRDGK